VWIDLYSEATQLPPFRTLREIQGQILPRVLRQFDVGADAAPYVDLFFRVTTKVELYPETLKVLNALGPVRSAVVSNADHEHLAAWNFTLPVERRGRRQGREGGRSASRVGQPQWSVTSPRCAAARF